MIGVFFKIFITEIILLFITINIIKIIRYKKILKNLDKDFEKFLVDLDEEPENIEIIENDKELKEMIDIINKYKKEEEE